MSSTPDGPSSDDYGGLSAEEASSVIAIAQQVLGDEAAAVARVAAHVGGDYCRALDLILGCSGRLIVLGVGKSGLIGRKIAATFSSTGQPSSYLHPADALDGGLGIVTDVDVALFLSNSGETEELVRLLPWFADRGVAVIALTGTPNSTIGRQADVTLDASVEREACPLNLVPTTSAIAALAVTEALAMSAMRARGFGARDFQRLQPDERRGRRHAARVAEVMRRHGLPFVHRSATVRECVSVMSRDELGLAIVVDDSRKLCGIVTDGDLRRGLERLEEPMNQGVASIMTESPVSIGEGASVLEADQRMRRLRIKALIVRNVHDEVVGIVELFDS